MNDYFDSDEARILIGKASRGDLFAMAALWEHVERFVYKKANHILRSSRNYGAEEKDLEQAGRIALWQAVRKFDPERGPFFFHLFTLYLKNEFAIACGYKTSKRDPLIDARSLDEPISKDETDGATLGDLVPDPADPIDEADRNMWNAQLHSALDRSMTAVCSDQQREIICKHYYDGLPVKSIANRLGLPAQRVSQIEHRAFQKLERRQELQAFLDENTPFTIHIGINTFKRTRTSAVEWLVMRREDMIERITERAAEQDP